MNIIREEPADMSTFLFHEVIFGPVKSRRLGYSLGVNLLPVDSKICSFNCVYCECGWNPKTTEGKKFGSRTLIYEALSERLEAVMLNHELLDVITFAGNGEPTLHPDFLAIVEDVATLRDRFVPGVKIALLTNSTMIWNDKVKQALKLIDLPILKLDSAIPETLLAINNPGENFDTAAYYDNLKKMPAGMIIQTMFLKGSVRGLPVDNTTEAELSEWLDMLEVLKPREVQIYSLDRVPPANLLTQVPRTDLDIIAARVAARGIKTLVV